VALLPLRGPRLKADLRAACRDLGRIAAGRDAAAFRAGLTRAVILAALGETQGALAAAARASASSPYASAAMLVRARVLEQAGRRSEAAEELARGLAIEPRNPDLLGLRASLRLADGDPRGAIADYDTALSRSHGESLYLGKASALMMLGEDRSALAEWSWALRRDPGLPEAFLGRARTYFRLRQWDLGLADLEQAAAWGHGDPGIEAAVALSYLGCLPMRLDRFPRLFVHLRRATIDLWRSIDGRDHVAADLDAG
jgi:tetratricopeptide (TPR) repeat protein